MISSCKLSPHRHLRYEVQHQHRYKRLTPKIHFSYDLVLAAVAFTAVCMFSYQNQVLAEETTIFVQHVEFTTEHVAHDPEIKVNVVDNAKVRASNTENNSTNESSNDTTRFYAIDFTSTQQPDYGEQRLQSGVKDTSQVDERFYIPPEHTAEINNDIFSNVEENTEIKIFPNGDFLISDENLEESIRNSVKTEMEKEQNLESSPVLEILKELPEPEIRKTLTADIMSLDQQNRGENAMLLKVNEEVIKDSSESILKMLKSGMENKTTRGAKNLEFPQLYEKVFKTKKGIFQQPELVPEIRNIPVATLENLENSSRTESCEEPINLENGEHSQFINESNKIVKSSSSSSSELNSSKNFEENFREKENISVNRNLIEKILHNQIEKNTTSLAKSWESNISKNSKELFKDNDNEFLGTKATENIDKPISENVDISTPENSHDLHFVDISDSSYTAMFNADESGTPKTKDDVFSVALNETYTATLLCPTDENCVDNLDLRDIVTLNVDGNVDDNNMNDTLSVVLNETFSANLPNPGDENRFSIEENQEDSVELVREEEMEESTAVPGEFEHVVIKKVLDVQEIYDDIVETTVTSFVQKNEIKSKAIGKQSAVDPVVKQIVYDENERMIPKTESEIPQDKKIYSNGNQKDSNPEEIVENQSNSKHVKPDSHTNHVLSKCNENTDTKECGRNAKEGKYKAQPYETIVSEVVPSTTELGNKDTTESLNYYHFASTTASSVNAEIKHNLEFHIVDANSLEDAEHVQTVKGSRSVNSELFSSQYEDDSAATLFKAYAPRDAGQTLNDNLADEYAGIGKALPVSITDGFNRSTIIIVLSSGTAFLFIVISVTILLISFQRQHGTLDIEMQERSCGKDDLDEEDAETFAKLLEVELPPSVAIALDETEECL